MITVGCDFGLRKSGIVVLDTDFTILSQNLIQVPEHIKGARRLVEIEKAFDAILHPFKTLPLNIFIENYAYGAKYQRESLAELGGVMRRYLYLQGYDFWTVPPPSLKFFVTGVGNANKNYMKKMTKEKWAETFKSDDVCDAYGLARLGLCVAKALREEEFVFSLPENERGIVQDLVAQRAGNKNPNTAKRKKNVKAKRASKG